MESLKVVFIVYEIVDAALDYNFCGALWAIGVPLDNDDDNFMYTRNNPSFLAPWLFILTTVSWIIGIGFKLYAGADVSLAEHLLCTTALFLLEDVTTLHCYYRSGMYDMGDPFLLANLVLCMISAAMAALLLLIATFDDCGWDSEQAGKCIVVVVPGFTLLGVWIYMAYAIGWEGASSEWWYVAEDNAEMAAYVIALMAGICLAFATVCPTGSN